MTAGQPTPADPVPEPVERALAARSYPLPDPGRDDRFSFGLVADLADLLVDHGYPPPQPRDTVHLLQLLFRFLYRTDDGPPTGMTIRHR